LSTVEHAEASFQQAQAAYEDAWRALDKVRIDDVRAVEDAYAVVDRTRIAMFRAFDHWHYLQRTVAVPTNVVRSLLMDMLREESLVCRNEPLIARLSEQLQGAGICHAVQEPVLCQSCRWPVAGPLLASTRA
jgi:hypothetical protein